jgi:hypothetical protein
LTSELVTDAERLACICRSRTRDKAIAWLKKEVEDAQGYVGEQLAIDPDDAEWQRIQAILAGAQAGLAADLHPDRLDNEGKPDQGRHPKNILEEGFLATSPMSIST